MMCKEKVKVCSCNLMRKRIKGRSYYPQVSDTLRKGGHKLECGKFRLDIMKIVFILTDPSQRGSMFRGVQDVAGQILSNLK